VIVGFLHIEKKSAAEIEALTRAPRFDYYCWDLYARVRSGTRLRRRTARAAPKFSPRSRNRGQRNLRHAELVATAVLRRHLETMDRLDIQYDFLPREAKSCTCIFGLRPSSA